MLVQPGVEADTLPTLQGVEPGKGLTLAGVGDPGKLSAESDAALKSIAREAAQKILWRQLNSKRHPVIDVTVHASVMTGRPYVQAVMRSLMATNRLRAYVTDELTTQAGLKTPVPDADAVWFKINVVNGDDTGDVNITMRPALEPVVLGEGRFFLPSVKDLAADALIREGVETLPVLENAVVVAGHGTRGRMEVEGTEANAEGLLAYLEQQGILTFTVGTDRVKRYDVEYLVLEGCGKLGGEHGTLAQELAELTGLGVVTPSGVVSGMGPFTGQFLSTQTHVMADGKIVPALLTEVKPWTLHRRGQDPQALKNDLVESLRELNLKPVVAKQPFKSADHNQIINFAKTEAATDSSVEPSGTEEAQDQQSDITPALTRDQLVQGIVSDVLGFRRDLGEMERKAKEGLRDALSSDKVTPDDIKAVVGELATAEIVQHLSPTELSQLAWVAAEIGHRKGFEAAERYVTSMAHGLDVQSVQLRRMHGRVSESFDILAEYNPSALKYESLDQIKAKVLALASSSVNNLHVGDGRTIALAKSWEQSTVDVGSAGMSKFFRWTGRLSRGDAAVLSVRANATGHIEAWCRNHDAGKAGTWRYRWKNPNRTPQADQPAMVHVGEAQPLPWAGDVILYAMSHANSVEFAPTMAAPTLVSHKNDLVPTSPKHYAELIASDRVFWDMLDWAEAEAACRPAGAKARAFSVVLNSCNVVKDVGQARFSAEVVASHLAERVTVKRGKEFEDAARELAREVGFADWDAAKFVKLVREFVAASSRLPLADASARAQEVARRFTEGLGKPTAAIDPELAESFAEALAKTQQPIPEGMRLFATPYLAGTNPNGVLIVEAPPGTADAWLEFPVGLPVRGRVVPRAGVG
ncbi:hypothetical protein, partial [Streptomyces sp. NPDC000410]|uniref:hypothetical protein n=1 Tax=Streptomyces sp. NPDC000410 TaxID=3154254 RepID=UPI003319561B